jgi:hypothetical protein
VQQFSVLQLGVRQFGVRQFGMLQSLAKSVSSYYT